jgi:outer membrane protein assembly factor BamB
VRTRLVPRRPARLWSLLLVGVAVGCTISLAYSGTALQGGVRPEDHPAPVRTEAIRSPTGSNDPSGEPGVWSTYLYDTERTGANPFERILSPSNVSQLQVLWTLPTNGSDLSAPIVVNGTVYFGSWNGYEYAVNAATGQIEWQTYLGIDDCGVAEPQGISSTPAYLDGTLYLGGGGGSADGSATYWYALNATNGSVDWDYLEDNNTTNAYNWASSLVYNGSLYVGVSSCYDNPLVVGGLREVNLTGNHTASHVFAASPPGEVGESIWSTPALDPSSNTVWVTTGNEDPSEGYPIYANAVIALNATTLSPLGSWQIPSTFQGEDSDFGGTPTLVTTSTGVSEVIASNKDGYTYAFNASNVSSDGTWGPIWTLYTGGGWGGGAFDGQTLYLAGSALGEPDVVAVDPDSGAIVWNTSLPDGGGPWDWGALTWANGVLYANGAGPVVYAIDAANGTVLWQYTLPPGEATVSEPVVEGGRLYVASGDFGDQGALTAFGIPLVANASATVVNGTAPLSVGFSGTAQGGVPPYSFTWQFGDGSTSNGSSTSHTFTDAGLFVVQLTVTDAGNDSTTIGVPIDVDATYDVDFTSTGLPSGTEWWVNLTNGQSYNSSATILSFSEPSGTYNYSAASANKSYSAADASFTVSGSGVSETLDFDPVAYAISFTEVGLPVGTPWSVIVNGATEGSTGSAVTFDEMNGTYAYFVEAVSGWSQSTLPYSGSVRIAGLAVIEPTLGFGRVTYPVNFDATGLPTGVAWWVNLTGGPSIPSDSTFLSFREPNGSYTYSVATADKGYSPVSGGDVLDVGGTSVSQTVMFDRVTYLVTFTETGLEPGTNWSLTLIGNPSDFILGAPVGNNPVSLTLWSVGASTVSFSVSNGSYQYSGSTQGGMSAIGNLTVLGPVSTPIPISFSISPSAGPGLPILLYATIGTAALAVAIGGMIFWKRRRDRPPPGLPGSRLGSRGSSPPTRP